MRVINFNFNLIVKTRAKVISNASREAVTILSVWDVSLSSFNTCKVSTRANRSNNPEYAKACQLAISDSGASLTSQMGILSGKGQNKHCCARDTILVDTFLEKFVLKRGQRLGFLNTRVTFE